MRHVVKEALDALAETVDRLAALREWHALEQEELRPTLPPSFRFCSHTSEDALSAYSAFLAGALAVQAALNDPDLAVSPVEKRQWQERLDTLQADVRRISAGERFIRT